MCHDLVVLGDRAIFDTVQLQCSVFAQRSEPVWVGGRKLAEPYLVPILLQGQVTLVRQD